MVASFGWKTVIAAFINATVVMLVLRPHLADCGACLHERKREPHSCLRQRDSSSFLAAVVAFAHHPVIFLSLFLFFLGFMQAYAHYQTPLILKEALLVGIFLAGLVVLEGM